MEIAVGITLLIIVIAFTIYSGICVKHAARFRYLSTRTVYLSLAYVTLATILIMTLLGVYIWYILG